MTLLSKISKTKKRLSDDRFIFLHCVAFGLSGILAVTAYSFRLLAFPRHWASTEFDIPVVNEHPVPSSEALTTITERTAAVVLSSSALYFGSLEAFSRKFDDPEKKFMIPHQAGKAQFELLSVSLKNWMQEHKILTSQVAVVIPSSDVPIETVLQLVNFMRNQKIFEKVILGGGIN